MRFISTGMIPLYSEGYALGKSEGALYEGSAGTSLLALCREGFSIVARTHPAKTKRVMIPGYTCKTVAEPFMEQNWTVAYYGVGRDLRIDETSFLGMLEYFRPDVIVVHPYYGMELNGQELALLAKAKAAGCFIVEDFTQSALSKHRPEVVDCYTGSLRKWFGIPDGAFYECAELPAPPEAELEESTDLVEGMINAMYARGVYFQNGDPNMLKLSRYIVHTTGEGKHRVTEPHKMSAFSRRILAKEDFEKANAQRIKNANYLYDRLCGSKKCEVIYKDRSDIATGPLWFPIYIEDRKRVLKERLRPKNISAVRLWPVDIPGCLVNDTVKEIFDNILCLPCGQIVDETDMQAVVDAIEHD